MEEFERMRKPVWLNKKVDLSAGRQLKGLLRELNLHTVCEESLCPNISQCFNLSTAAFMILGNVCTRNCRFCGAKNGLPRPIDTDEPLRVKEAAARLKLEFVVVTSPARDDLEDGGAGVFIEVVRQLKSLTPIPKVEILIPDFLGNLTILEKIALCGADVIAHNLETVSSLYGCVRPQAGYRRSLDVLESIKRINGDIITKSGFMLGLGEEDREVFSLLRDLREVNCDFLTIGQYLAPSLKHHYPVKKYIPIVQFDYWQKQAIGLGFKKVKSSPYMRSSFLAHNFFKK